MGIPLESGTSSSKKNIGEPRLPNTTRPSRINKPVFLGKIIKKGLADKAQIL